MFMIFLFPFFVYLVGAWEAYLVDGIGVTDYAIKGSFIYFWEISAFECDWDKSECCCFFLLDEEEEEEEVDAVTISWLMRLYYLINICCFFPETTPLSDLYFDFYFFVYSFFDGAFFSYLVAYYFKAFFLLGLGTKFLLSAAAAAPPPFLLVFDYLFETALELTNFFPFPTFVTAFFFISC